MRKILYIVDTFAILGGLERVLADKMNWLSEHGFRISLLTVNQGSHGLAYPLNKDIDICNLDILFHRKYQYPLWKRILIERSLQKRFSEALANRIDECSPDVIVFTQTGYVKNILKVCGSIPVVFESHSSCLYFQFAQLGIIEKLRHLYRYHYMKRVAVLIALTQGDSKVWHRWIPRVKIIPNVVHLNDLDRVSDCCAKNVIFIGRYSHQKDIWSLLKIWELVHQRHPGWTLNLFGDYGDQRDVLLPEIKKMNANVVVHELTQDIGKEYMKNSMLLLTSLYEPFGLVMPEAMSYGLPVVAFDCPYGPSDIITDGVDGFLVKDRSIEGFADRVCQLIEDEDLRRRMGAAGVQSSQRYSAENIMPLWRNLFESIIRNE